MNRRKFHVTSRISAIVCQLTDMLKDCGPGIEIVRYESVSVVSPSSEMVESRF